MLKQLVQMHPNCNQYWNCVEKLDESICVRIYGHQYIEYKDVAAI